MAEAIFRHLGKDIIDVKSAGSNPSGVNPFVYKVIGEIGVSTEGLFSKNVTQFLDDNAAGRFDYVITVCDRMKQVCPVFVGEYKKIHWSLQDPAEIKGTEEEILTAFRKTRNILKALIIDFLKVPLDKANIRCPFCGNIDRIGIVEEKCLVFYKCSHCGRIISTPEGSCCVICGYSDKVCGEFLKNTIELYGKDVLGKKEE